jgi:hypothetical protein
MAINLRTNQIKRRRVRVIIRIIKYVLIIKTLI